MKRRGFLQVLLGTPVAAATASVLPKDGKEEIAVVEETYEATDWGMEMTGCASMMCTVSAVVSYAEPGFGVRKVRRRV